ncbi:hypothetical protein ACFLQR_02595 [Verrucomicrobiota bacterium]
MIKRIITALVLCPMVTGIAYAKRASWHKDQKPPVSLQQALKLAEAELKSDNIECFCAIFRAKAVHLGATRQYVKSAMGEPSKVYKRTISYEWGPSKGWSMKNEGKKVEIWEYLRDDGTIRIFYDDGGSVVIHKDFSPKGRIY